MVVKTTFLNDDLVEDVYMTQPKVLSTLILSKYVNYKGPFMDSSRPLEVGITVLMK